jgi:hypothetical protein
MDLTKLGIKASDELTKAVEAEFAEVRKTAEADLPEELSETPSVPTTTVGKGLAALAALASALGGSNG